MICRINNKYYRFNCYLIPHLLLRPIIKNYKKRKISEPEPVSKPGKKFIMAAKYLGLVYLLFFVIMLLSAKYNWIAPLTIVAILIGLIVFAIKGSIFLIKESLKAVKKYTRIFFSLAKRVWQFKIIFYRIGNRWL